MANSLLPNPHFASCSLDQLHKRFLSILPNIEAHARFTFRSVCCPFQKEDAIAELIALAWKWFRYLAQKDQHAKEFLASFLAALARAVAKRLRLPWKGKGHDALNRMTEQVQGYQIEAHPGTKPHHNFNTLFLTAPQPSIPEQVAFRLDFLAWCKTRPEKDQHVIQDLMAGECLEDVADNHGLSFIQVVQLRRDLLEDWNRFTNSETI